MTIESHLPHQLVFSGGTGRSGTTIIGKLLDKHAKVRASRPLEIKFLAGNAGLLDLTLGRRDFIEMKKRQHRFYRVVSSSKLLTRWTSERKFRQRICGVWWDPDPRPGKGSGLSVGLRSQVRDEALSRFFRDRKVDPIGAAREFFETLISEQSNNREEDIWIDTSPPNVFNANRIIKILPKAKFIHMKRDGRNTIASVLKEHWGPSEPLKAIQWWKNRVIASHEALLLIPKDHVLEIQLEDFACFDRENQYQRILEFLDIDDDSVMRNFFGSQVDGARVAQSRWRDEITEPKFEKKFLEVRKELREMGITSRIYD